MLTVGIGLLTILGWGVNGLFAARPSPAQAALTGRSAPAGHARAHRHRHRQDPAPSPRPTPVRSPHQSPAPVPAAGKVPACAPGGVTLSLSSPQYWYQTGATPQFTVRARAHGQPCRFNMASTFVSVVVTAAGRRIWSSADCAKGSGSSMTVLTGSRPAVLRVAWDRRTSAAGCTGASRPVRPGEYQVTAVAGHLHSRTANVVLGAAGASGP